LWGFFIGGLGAVDGPVFDKIGGSRFWACGRSLHDPRARPEDEKHASTHVFRNPTRRRTRTVQQFLTVNRA
jgi:hypothetical protein